MNSLVYELRQELKDCKSILDLGCGSSSPIGGLRLFLANVHLVGVDAFAPSIKSSRRKGIHDEYFLMNVLDIEGKFGRKSFDCVAALDLIEHLQKKEGSRLLEIMEKMARKKVVISTPNGFLAQRAYDGNVSQIHRSGWTTEEMRARGYRVVGVNGWKPLKGEFGKPIISPARLGEWISSLTTPFVRHKPEKAFEILCIKDLEARATITLSQSGNYLPGKTRGIDVNAHLFQISILDS